MTLKELRTALANTGQPDDARVLLARRQCFYSMRDGSVSLELGAARLRRVPALAAQRRAYRAARAGRRGVSDFPEPRYEVRPIGMRHVAFDASRGVAVLDSESSFEREVARTVAALNREYQRWLTDRFYDRAVAETA